MPHFYKFVVTYRELLKEGKCPYQICDEHDELAGLASRTMPPKCMCELDQQVQEKLELDGLMASMKKLATQLHSQTRKI